MTDPTGKDAAVLYAYTQSVPIDLETYGKIVERLGPTPLEGLMFHLVTRRADGGLQYTDVWESQAACERAFEDRIHPAVYGVFAEIGFRPEGEPQKQQLDVVDLFQGSFVPHAAARHADDIAV
jgi:hypothetical protein